MVFIPPQVHVVHGEVILILKRGAIHLPALQVLFAAQDPMRRLRRCSTSGSTGTPATAPRRPTRFH